MPHDADLLRMPVRWGPHVESSDARDHTESAIGHRRAIWELPRQQTALVLVDIWHTHALQSYRDRTSTIVRDRIVPVVDAARRAGVIVIHAPSPEVAARYAPAYRQVEERLRAVLRNIGLRIRPVLVRVLWCCARWPPVAFRQRRDPYAAFARPRSSGWAEANRVREIPGALRPLTGEPVVFSGVQLHRLLRARRILHLVYVGFAANLCVKWGRDYSMMRMCRRGYNLILLRDCTTGIEVAETADDLALTRAATVELEWLCASATADEFLAACAPHAPTLAPRPELLCEEPS